MIASKKVDFAVLLLGRLLQVFVTLAALRLSTSWLGESDLGTVYYITAIQIFFSLFLINPVGQYFNRQTNKWYKNGSIVDCLVKQTKYIFSIAIISLILLLTLSRFNVISIGFEGIVILSGLVFSTSINQTIVPLFNMLGKRREFVSLNLVTSVLALVLSMIFMWSYSYTANMWILGIVASNLCIACFGFIYLYRSLSNDGYKFTKESYKLQSSIKKIAKFSIPIGIATVFMWFLLSGYRIAIENKMGLVALAFIGVGLSVSGQIFSILESILTQFFVPDVYRKIEGVNYDDRMRVFANYAAINLPIYLSVAIFMTFSVKYIMPLIVDSKYHSAYVFAMIGIWAEFFRVVANIFGLLTQIENKTSLLTPAYVVGALFLATVVSLFELSELTFCAVLAVSHFLSMGTMYFMSSKYFSVNLPFKELLLVFVFMLPVMGYFSFIEGSLTVSLSSLLYLLAGGVVYLFSMGILVYRYIGRDRLHI